nr:DUF6114 domain-containing protein [Methanomassiliicoccus luminyensis]
MATPPAAAYVLMLLAGVLVIINGMMSIAVGRSLDVAIFEAGALVGVAGVLMGAGMLLAASRLNSRPAEHVRLGAAVIVLSLASLVLAGGGFIIGSAMGVGGGILAIVWRV